jgi:hypothetical protein
MGRACRRRGVAADLSAIGWFHGRLAGASADVCGPARVVLRALARAGQPTARPAPVLSVGALLAMARSTPALGTGSAVKVVRSASVIYDMTRVQGGGGPAADGSHSPRAGFTTDALDAGATREDVQTYGGCQNAKSLDPYYRRTSLWGTTNPASRLAHLDN